MDTLIDVFHTYSAREGDKHKLCKRELKDLLQNELGEYLEEQKDATSVDKILKELDKNGDGEVDFQEFVTLLDSLTVVCNTVFCKKQLSHSDCSLPWSLLYKGRCLNKLVIYPLSGSAFDF
ncbi:unnamed protein product [Staurois parvus]|uniref:Protein S100 n=1 Tax=Staurois parvus TaxID=386267 RepID=A0ABN9GAW3_9NEOB|nr:unnamed protein product [Staurois parvus]